MHFWGHVPAWVWLILLFLLHRGVAALRPQQIALRRLFVVPLLFLCMSIVHLSGFTLYPATVTFAGFWLLGALLRVASMQRGALRYDLRTGMVIRAGSPATLLLVLTAFGWQFGLHYWLAIRGQGVPGNGFAGLWGAGSGMLTGLVWGGVLPVLAQAWPRRT